MGSARNRGDNPGLHPPRFDFNNALIPAAVGFWVHLALSQLSPP